MSSPPPTMIPKEEEVEPPQKKTKLPPLPPCQSFSSLPYEIAINCFARISKSRYPELSLVSKTFHSLIISPELHAARSQTGTTEICLYICLKFSTVPYFEQTRRWFRLKMRPNPSIYDGRILERSSENEFIPFHISPPLPYSKSTVTIGSDIYLFGGPTDNSFEPTSAVRVYDRWSRTWRDLPSMKKERAYASACVVDGKIYVMGGCRAWYEWDNWFEMFDMKTQTWETLPANPDRNVRLGNTVCKIGAAEGKIYVKTAIDLNDWIYDLKEGVWSVADVHLSLLSPNSWCVIDNVMYSYSFSRYVWYDVESKKWRDVKGLEVLRKYRSLSSSFPPNYELVNYGGKLAILWDKFERPGRSQNKNIWCAVVALRRCPGGAIVGNVEWVDVVLTVPRSYNFLRSLAVSI